MEDNHMKHLWREACGEVPQGFINRLHRSLGQASKRQPQRRLRPILSAALGLVLLLGSAVALESLGLLDTLDYTLRKALLPGAKNMVQTDILQVAKQPQLAHFTVEEAVYDGHQAYLTLLVTPADATKTLLMDVQAESAWAHDWQSSDNPNQGESFAEKAAASGKSLVQPEVWDALVNGNPEQARILSSLYLDGDIRYTLSFPAQGAEANLQLNLLAPNIYSPLDDSARGTLDVTLQKSPHILMLAARTPVSLPQAGLSLTLCRVETTPIASYLTLRYALLPDAASLQAVNLNDGVWADWIGQDGNPRKSADPWNVIRTLPDGGVELVQSFGALKETSDSITLSFYNGKTGERFDHITLALSPKEEN